jgi:hypothetical protein
VKRKTIVVEWKHGEVIDDGIHGNHNGFVSHGSKIQTELYL